MLTQRISQSILTVSVHSDSLGVTCFAQNQGPIRASTQSIKYSSVWWCCTWKVTTIGGAKLSSCPPRDRICALPAYRQQALTKKAVAAEKSSRLEESLTTTCFPKHNENMVKSYLYVQSSLRYISCS